MRGKTHRVARPAYGPSNKQKREITK